MGDKNWHHLKRISAGSLKITAWIVAILTALILCFGTYLYFQEARVKKFILEAINQRLIVEVQVEDVQFSIFRSFPYTSLDFIGVRAKGSHSEDPEHLLIAKRISLHFNVMDIYYGHYDIKRLDIDEGDFNIKCYQGADYNFRIWKTDSANIDFRFALNKIQIKNTRIRYRDMEARYDYRFDLENLSAKGNFDQSQQEIWIKGKYGDCRLQHEDYIYLQNKTGDFTFSIHNQIEKNYCQITEGIFAVNGLRFAIKGPIWYKTATRLDLHIAAQDLSLRNFLSLLPRKQQDWFTDYKSKGNLNFEIKLDGDYHKKNGLSIEAIFSCKDTEITHNPTKTTLSRINLAGTFSNGIEKNLRASSLVLKHISASMPSGKFSGRFSINDWVEPLLKCEILCNANLEELNHFLGYKNLFFCSGSMRFELAYQNRFSSFDFSKIGKDDFLNSQCHGSVVINDFNFSSPELGYSAQAQKLAFDFTPQDILFPATDIKINRQEINLQATFGNVFPALFIADQKTNIKACLKAKQLSLDLLLPSYTADSNSFSFPLLFRQLNCDIAIDQLSYQRIVYKNIRTLISADENQYEFPYFSLELLDGSSTGSMRVKKLSNKRYLLNVDMKNQGIHIQKALESYHNFGQNLITSDNISGILDNELQLSLVYDTLLGIDLNSILLWTQIKVSEGKFKNTNLFKLLAKYTGEKDLESIQFADLSNIIEIKNGIIYIPEMSIFSNALNLRLNGEHGFNGRINYLIQVELSELLSRRRQARKAKEKKNQNKEFGIEEESGKSVVILPIRITGTVEQPIIKYDFAVTKKHISEASKKEGVWVKQILKEEFSSEKNKQNQIEKNQWKEQEKGKFEVEWEEAPAASTDPKAPTSTPQTKEKPAKFKIEWTDD